MPATHLRRSLAVLVLASTSGAALAQPASPPPAPPQTPAQPPAQALPVSDITKPNPYMKLVRRREWTVRVQITLQADAGVNYATNYSFNDRFRFDAMTMVFPVVQSSASSLWREGSIDSTLYVEQTPVDTRTELIGPYHSNAVYARFDTDGGDARTVRLLHTHQTTSWDTVFNELEAIRVPWPTGPWPDEAQSTFGPQQYVNPQGAPGPSVAALVSQWTQGKDPKSISPVLLAKWLAGQVQELVQLQGDGVNRAYSLAGGFAVEGVELQGAENTSIFRRGSSHDMTCLLAAVYRAAGLPARTVIGIDDDPERRSREVRSWVEFCLYDEANQIVTWVPVDIAQLRSSSSRMRALDRPWEYFGIHDELHEIAPFAFHFIPPIDVRSYNSPAFYGWRQTPRNAPFAAQMIDLDVTRTVQRGAPTSVTPTP